MSRASLAASSRESHLRASSSSFLPCGDGLPKNEVNMEKNQGVERRDTFLVTEVKLPHPPMPTVCSVELLALRSKEHATFVFLWLVSEKFLFLETGSLVYSQSHSLNVSLIVLLWVCHLTSQF